MIRNYFILTLRNIRKHKLFSFINVLGLAIGISASLVICLIVQYDFSFDRHHKDGDRIYRVVSSLEFSGSHFDNSGVPAPLPVEARKDIPGLENTAAFHTMYKPRVSLPATAGKKPVVFRERKGVIFTDQHYFGLFPQQWITGTPNDLKEPFKVVLTESRAREYFPHLAPAKTVGRFLHYDDTIQVTVAGILKDGKETTDLVFQEFISLATIPAKKMEEDFSWTTWNNYNSSSQCFVKLKPGVSPGKTAELITRLVQKNGNDTSKGFSAAQLLQPLSDLHFNDKYEIFDQRRAHKPTLVGLLIVAAFLLLLGCINFINLTTAQAAQRAKEVGIRKTMGSSKSQLIAQFLNETAALTIIATLLSIAFVPWLLKAFENYIPEGVTLQRLGQPAIIAVIIALVILVSLLAGFYPSLVLSRFNPVLALKNQAYGNTGKTRTAWLRKTLTVSQFIIAQFFIIGTLMVSKQIHYSLSKDLGYRKDAIITFSIPWRESSNTKNQALLQKLRNMPGIQKVAFSGLPPASTNTSSSTITFDDGKKTVDRMTEIRIGDAAYFDIYKIKLIAGRMLLPSDTVRKEYLVNEAYAREMGYTDPAGIVGKHIRRDQTLLPIVGVVGDFHTKSLHMAITPLVFTAKSAEARAFHLLLTPQQPGSHTWQTTLNKIDQALKETHPDRTFDFTFFDDQIAGFYKTEQSTSRLLTWASGLAIFISCLGLLGLVIYTTHQRVKEIGVRKVLGASVTQIVSLLSKDFIILVILAFAITAPIAWWAANTWLQNFAYRTSVSWWIFAAGGGIMVVIALLTLSIQTIRAALANPVRSLRSE